MSPYDAKLRTFLDFVLDQYVQVGVEALNADKLPNLLRLKYSDVAEAANELGGATAVREAFMGFQKDLYR